MNCLYGADVESSLVEFVAEVILLALDVVCLWLKDFSVDLVCLPVISSIIGIKTTLRFSRATETLL